MNLQSNFILRITYIYLRATKYSLYLTIKQTHDSKSYRTFCNKIKSGLWQKYTTKWGKSVA